MKEEHIEVEGVINTVEVDSHTVNITHEPIPALNWPTMTMDFPTAQGIDLEQLRPDRKLRFRISEGEDGRYQIDAIQPSPPTSLPATGEGSCRYARCSRPRAGIAKSWTKSAWR